MMASLHTTTPPPPSSVGDSSIYVTSKVTRRSVSVFSRRGSEIRERTPVVPSSPIEEKFDKAIMAKPTQNSSSKQKRWTLRCKTAGAPQGTILRAVPQSGNAPGDPTPLELAMATSPNEEILNNIGRRDSATSGVDSSAYHVLPQASTPVEGPSSTTPNNSRKQKKSKPRPTVIGVWKGGEVEWDYDADQFSSSDSLPRDDSDRNSIIDLSTAAAELPEPKPAPAPKQQILQLTQQSRRSSSAPPSQLKPKIQVIIPKEGLQPRFPPAPFIRPILQFPNAPPTAQRLVSRDAVPPLAPLITKAEAVAAAQPARKSQSPVKAHRPKPRRPWTMSGPPATVPELVEEPDEEEIARQAAKKQHLSASALPTITTSTTINEASVSAEATHVIRPSISSSSSSDRSRDEDEVSNYSRRSSITSLEDNEVAPQTNLMVPSKKGHKRGPSVFSIDTPVSNGVFESSAESDRPKSAGPDRKTSLSPVAVIERPSTSGVDRPYQAYQPFRHAQVEYIHAPSPRASPVERIIIQPPSPPESTKSSSSKRSKSKNLKIVNDYPEPPPERPAAPVPVIHERSSSKKLHTKLTIDTQQDPSPTLTEAEEALHGVLTAVSEDAPFKWDDIGPVTAPIAPPPKSSRRKTVFLPRTPILEKPEPDDPDASQKEVVVALGGGRSASDSAVPTLSSYSADKGKARADADSYKVLTSPSRKVNSPSRKMQAALRAAERNIPAEAAEMVILSIMENLESLEDLFNTALLNKGFYRVFKRHELHLIRTVLQTMSPAAWEFREVCGPTFENEVIDEEAPRPEYTPATYLQNYTRDFYIIATLKDLIVQRCQSFLRVETVAALSGEDASLSCRIDDALWRIWTFCQIFGSGKGREDDITAQLDWLRGGVLAHQQACRSTMISSDFEMSDTLLNASENFGKGNPGGLNAEQLYDMTEIWTCLGVLLQGIEGRTEQAREYGVYDSTDVRGGDIDGEEAMLEEWHFYLLTHGLAAILTLANPSTLPNTDPTVFQLAQSLGLMQWTPPPVGGSRGTFLKEAVSRVYEEKIAAIFSKEDLEKQEMKEVRRQRVQSLAAEIKLRRNTGDYREVRMSMERPMSEWEGVLADWALGGGMGSPTFSAGGSDEVAPRKKPSGSPTDIFSPVSPPSEGNSNNSNSMVPQNSYHNFQHPAYRHHRSTSSESSDSDTPSISAMSGHFYTPSAGSSGNRDSRASLQHPLQLEMMNDSPAATALNSVDRAIFRIVEMGFTAEQARHALRVTDAGDGLRVDSAVELLLREV